MVASGYEVLHECEAQSSGGYKIMAACEEAGLSAGASFAIAFAVLAGLAVGGLFLWRWWQARNMPR